MIRDLKTLTTLITKKYNINPIKIDFKSVQGVGQGIIQEELLYLYGYLKRLNI